MQRIYKLLSKTLRKVDLFPISNFIRYNGDHEFTTATGGLASIAVIIIFAVLFSNMGIRTLNRQIIQASTSILNDADPTPMSIITSPLTNFMFSINIYGLDLNDKTFRFFDIKLTQEFFGPGHTLINQTEVPLQKCTPQHFSFDSSISSTLNNFETLKGLCPPIGYHLSLSGKPTSQASSTLTLILSRCNTSELGCVNNTIFNAFQARLGDFMMGIPIINTELNPGSIDYKTMFIEDRNIFYFNSQMGLSITASLAETRVNTDISILPYQDIVQEKFPVLPNLFTAMPFLKTESKPFVKIGFSKATTTVVQARSFYKIDSYFSYVGGLIGTIIGFIFILNIYTQKAYEISISHKIFKDSEKQPVDSASFNIFYFFSMAIKQILNLFRCRVNWQKTQKFVQCCEEINLQLDIGYILRKLMFLQKSIEILFKKHQIQALYYCQKPSLSQIKDKRMKFSNSSHNGKKLFQIEGHDEFQKKQSSPNSIQNEYLHQGQESSKQTVSNTSQYKQKPHQNQQIHACVQRIVQQSKRGNAISCKILSQLDKQLFPQLIKLETKIHQVIKAEQQCGYAKMREPKYKDKDFIIQDLSNLS